jgi:hypothetical protein
VSSPNLLSNGTANRADIAYAAHRDDLTSRLSRETRIRPESVEHFVSAWEAEAAQRGLDRLTAGWWEPAWDWIVNHRWMAIRSPQAMTDDQLHRAAAEAQEGRSLVEKRPTQTGKASRRSDETDSPKHVAPAAHPETIKPEPGHEPLRTGPADPPDRP